MSSSSISTVLSRLHASLFEHTEDGVLLTGADGTVVRANPCACRMLGRTEEEIIQAGCAGLVVDEAELWRLLAVPANRGASSGVVRFRRKDGSAFPAEGAFILDEGGRTFGILIFRDVTRRERDWDAPRRSDGRFRDVVENLPDGIVRVDGEGRVVECNPAFCDMVGYTADELRTMTLAAITPERWRESELRDVLAHFRDQRPTWDFEKEFRRKDGRIVPVEMRGFIRYEDGHPADFWAVVRDVTRRKGAEAALRAASLSARSLIEASLDPLVTISPDGKITDVNRATEAATGVVRERIIGTDFADYFTEPDRARDGYREVLARGEVRDYPLTIRHVSGRLMQVLYNATVYRSEGGAVQGVFAAARDVTEERVLQRKLAVASRLAAMGTLVAGVGHEINNPLAVAMANDGSALADIDDLLARLAVPEPLDRQEIARALGEVRVSIESALSGDRRIARIVKDLVALGRTGTPRERVRLRDVVETAIRWLPAAVGEADAIQVEDASAPDVEGQPGQLAQVILNLITNAIQSGRPGTTPRVTVRVGPGSPGTARVEVVDDGMGMAPGVLARIFDPFYSTRETGQGTGLGLSICHAIVSEHGGTITATSEPGRGSTFRVELPVAAAPPPP